MKKLWALLLAGAMLLTISGCRDTGANDPDFSMPPVTPGASQTGHEGLEVRVESLTWNEEDGTVLVITWDNGCGKDVTYGSAYVIERLDGEEWVSCANGHDAVFDAVGYELRAGQSRKESYDLTWLYNVSMPGTYRFRTDCFVAEGGSKTVKCELTAEFTVGEDLRPTGGPESEKQVHYCARYFRTNPEDDGLEAPAIWVIGSAQDLWDYHNAYHARFGMEVMGASAGNRGSSDICGEYDEEFFAENFLVLLYMGQGSGSVHHEVRGVEQTADGKLAVSVDRKVPEIGTDDLVRWYILLELSRDVMVESADGIRLTLNGEDMPGSGAVVLPIPESPGLFPKQ